MAKLSNIELSNESNWLWPPVADSLDTFLRRRNGNAAGYERIWRLIHVWESVAVTLASVSVTRMRDDPELATSYRRAREILYGKTWSEADEEFGVSQGALGGSIDRWIDILWLVVNVEEQSDLFLTKLRAFLNTDAIKLWQLVEEWGKACDVSPDADRGEAASFTVREAIRHINSFRNRFAHVPFPNDPIDDLAEAFELVTEQLFSIDPLPSKHEGSVLTGGIIKGQRLFRGGQHFPYNGDEADFVRFIFPALRPKGADQLCWDARPFVYFNQMQRPHVLTRLKDGEHGIWEYTRFLADANAVVTEYDEALLETLACPSKDEYPTGEADEDEGEETGGREEPPPSKPSPPELERPAESLDEAKSAARRGAFDLALPYFEREVKEKSWYHTGWLRLGTTRREKAVRLSGEDRAATVDMLRQSVEELTRATGHRDMEQQAQAFYELSKARFRLGQLTGSAGDFKAARKEATEACLRSPEDRYQTWYDFVERQVRVLPGTADGESKAE